MTSSSPIATLQISLPTSSQPDQRRLLLTAPEYRHTSSSSILSSAKFHEVTDLLLEKPNLNSSHLFRADVVHDSAGFLKTKEQHEASLTVTANGNSSPEGEKDGAQAQLFNEASFEGPGPLIDGVKPHRTVLRTLIPRNHNLDRPLKQSCYLYNLSDEVEAVVYLPQVVSAEQMPWYHPTIKALAYVFEPHAFDGEAAVSVWYLPFEGEGATMANGEIPQRLHRTLLALGSTFLRLARYQPPTNGHSLSSNKAGTISGAVNGLATDTADRGGDIDLRPSALKDTILPQHIVQDTYARLKTTYAPFLIAKWVESTPPEKHVFEDLAIAAFLVCLWREMYGDAASHSFTGFVDLACGNGLLVYVLNKEGWEGWGIDARRRKTWEALGLDEKRSVREGVVVPMPFVDVLGGAVVEVDEEGEARLTESGMAVHNGIFEPGTFIISNHADELTVWTPLLAALSSPDDPLPFLAIPCCSHALSGEKYRYTPKDASLLKSMVPAASVITTTKSVEEVGKPNIKPAGPEQGSLLALRATHQRERDREGSNDGGTGGSEDKSAYGCLTRKTVQVARHLGIETTCTLMRIPSTRNVGVVACKGLGSRTGGGQDVLEGKMTSVLQSSQEDEGMAERRKKEKKIEEIVEQECLRSGGVEKSAETWVDRARKIHVGPGRGKVNWGGKHEGDPRKNEALAGREDRK